MFDNTSDYGHQNIVLAKLSEPIKFTKNVHSICLASNISYKMDDQETVAGWGVNWYTDEYSDTANENIVPLQPYDYCNANSMFLSFLT